MLSPISLAAATVTGAAYINAKLGISPDIRNLRHERDFEARVLQNVSLAGEYCTLYALFARGAERYPAREALWFEGRTWSYDELRGEVDRLAAFLADEGVRPGTYVAVFMSNSPEMVVSILALSKLGAVAALVNTNLRDETLRHCLDVPDAKIVLSTPELSDAIAQVAGDVEHFSLDFGSFNDTPAPKADIASVSLSDLPPLSTASQLPPAKRAATDLTCLIYTSGTTGHPKACAIRNFMLYVTGTPHTLDVLHPAKYLPLRTYSALPLFHGTCLFTGLTQTLGGSGAQPSSVSGGGTFILARKFSASRFFADVCASRATRILYVGELCRYLLSTPASQHDTSHAVLVANGNGLRSEIWDAFKARFNVPEVREFYRSTEGLAKFDNFTSGLAGAGKLAFSGPLRRWLEKDTFLIRVDPETGDVLRDKNGFCVRCRVDEAGEAIGRVKNRGLLTEYLHNARATSEKLLTDVFEKGDMFQRMGDLCVIRADGWVSFVERLGETFRWKGENVSAGEVRSHISSLPGVADALVFGVQLEAYDGKCGGAAISLSEKGESTAFMASLYGGLRKKGVPEYAVPRLVRITESIGTGVTFKQAKREIERKPWDADAGEGDELWWLNVQRGRYERLDGGAWRGIQGGTARL